MTIKGNELRAYLDDVRPCPSDYDLYWNSFGEAIKWMSFHGCPKHISFDHDLGPTDEVAKHYFRSGLDVAKFIVNKDLEMMGRFIPEGFTWNIHSMNPVGAENINSFLNSYLTMKSKSNG